MFSGGQVTSTDVANYIIPAIGMDYCPAETHRSEAVCLEWCPTVTQGKCDVPEMADPYAALPSWSSLPSGLSDIISDESHLGFLGYTAANAQAVYEAFKNKQTIPQPGASTTPAASTAQPTPPPPATTGVQSTQETGQEEQPSTPSRLVHGHGICGSIFYDLGSLIFPLDGPSLGAADVYGTGAEEFNGTMGGTLGYCGVFQNNMTLSAEFSMGVALAKTMTDIMGQEFQDSHIYYADGKVKVGYLFDAGAVGINLYAFAMVGGAWSPDDVFVNGLIGPFGWSSVDVGGGAGLALQVPLSTNFALNVGLEVGGRYTRQYIPGWRAGTESQVNATPLILDPSIGIMYLW